MLLNRHKLNTNKLNSETTGSSSIFAGGTVAIICQNVASSFSGLVGTLLQTVRLRTVYDATTTPVTICQNVQHTVDSPRVITINQVVE